MFFAHVIPYLVIADYCSSCSFSPPPFLPCFHPPSCLPPPCQAPWFTPPTMPVPLPLTQRVEGAGNPLHPVTHTPCPSPFPWHEEGCPRAPPPPLPLVHALRHAFPLHFTSTRKEGWNPPTPHFLPRPMHTSPICVQEPEPHTKGWRARGRARAEQWSNQHNKQWGEHHHQHGSSTAHNPGWGSAHEQKGGGAEKGSGGGIEP